jgi:hypothetical protein
LDALHFIGLMALATGPRIDSGCLHLDILLSGWRLLFMKDLIASPPRLNGIFFSGDV